MKTTLLAVTGLSPAVLTETVWKLARPDADADADADAGDPREAVIPDRVVALTTTRGAEAIRAQLFQPLPGSKSDRTVWQELRAALLDDPLADDRLAFGPDGEHVKIFSIFEKGASREIEDIRDAAESEAVADAMMRELWSLAGPESGTRVIASIAGGFKTMSALLFSCMTLMGRESDRITHVLVNDPFDKNVFDPPFYFPKQSAQSLSPTRQRVAPASASDARILLIDVPFVPLRYLFERELVRKPHSYSELIGRCGIGARQSARGSISLKVSQSRAEIEVSGRRVRLGPREQYLMLCLARRAIDMGKPFENHQDVGLAMVDGFEEAKRLCPFLKGIVGTTRFDEREVTRLTWDIGKKLGKARGVAAGLIPFLPEKGRSSLDLPAGAVEIVP
ncbi:MAG: TIGR02584 family CRISPR-associated protein [Verrucomicrobiae bacterium]|nr:TIGR02584 family CRISPR-associated protein [Verrucomicrobiae bacterium]